MNETFKEFNSDEKEYETFLNTRDLKFKIIYSPSNRISHIYFEFTHTFVENATNIDLNVHLSNGPYRNCVVDTKHSYSNHRKGLAYSCEFNDLKDYENQLITVNSIEMSFKSENIFKLTIYGFDVFYFNDECGFPDVLLHASYNSLNDKSLQFFPIPQKNKHRMIGDSVITCAYEGKWDKEPPIFESIIKCNTDEIDRNPSLKSIKRENFEFFNRTQVAVIDSMILFRCNNEQNSTKIHVLTCDQNGLWIGDDFKCKLKANIDKRFLKKVYPIFQVKRIEVICFQ
jgi:hypothetical protein